MKRIFFIANAEKGSVEYGNNINTIDNYISYFKTAYGGGWSDDEFFFENKIQASVFESLIQLITESSFCIFIFCVPVQKSKNDLQLILNRDLKISYMDLAKKINNGILIVDSSGNNTRASEIIEEESIYSLMLNKFDCKEFYKYKNLKECPQQLIQVSALNLPTIPNNGSSYSYFLLKTARSLVKKTIITSDFFNSYSFIRFPVLYEKTLEELKSNNLDTSDVAIQYPDFVNDSNSLIFTIIA